MHILKGREQYISYEYKEIMKVREKNSLLKKYIELRDNLIKTLENANYEIDVDGDLVDKLQGQNLINIQNKISQKNLTKFRAINLAIEMIENGKYGICQECGEDISIKRLEAIPGVSICVLCAELLELNK